VIVPEDGPATDIEWAVIGQALVWDGVIPSVAELAAYTYDLRHVWRLRWEDWQDCPADQAIHAEMMTVFLQNLSAPPTDRAAALAGLAGRHALPVTTGYLHSSVGLTSAGDLVLLMKTASLAELGQTHAKLGSRRAILLDNGGSVGAAYWSRFEWEKKGWAGIRDRPAFLGNGSYFRPRGHAVLFAELARDLPEGPSAEA
jgi:hypothetical protein